MSALLLLWDIDHTLTENNGVNKEIYALAFEMLTGATAVNLARTDGRTEPAIMRAMLASHGIEPTPGHMARLPEILETATRASAGRLRERGHELPGARDALTAFAAMPGVVQSVLSGNIAPNAVTKLAAFGLDGFMDFEAGGYGSDDEDRPSLVAIAQRRASARYGVSFGPESTVLVGDTLRDVHAGREGGGRVLAVATGSDSVAALRAEGADAVLPDLRDTAAVITTVTALAAIGLSRFTGPVRPVASSARGTSRLQPNGIPRRRY